MKKLDSKYAAQRELAINVGKKYKVQFNKISIAKNILNIFKLK